jgi:hypothetical protein
MTIKLAEATGAVGEKKGSRTYKCRLIAVGQGSSGFYSESMLSEYGPTAFPVGTHSYLNHKSYDEEWSQPERRVQDIAGVVTETPWMIPGDGLYSNIEFTEAGAKLVEELGEHIGLSIYATNAEVEEYDGGINVTKILPSPLNSVDIVTRAGAGGKIMELAESFRGTATESSTTDSRGDITERIKMDEKDIKAIAEAVKEAITPSLTALTEALKPVEPASEKTEGPDIAAVTEAVIDAGLPKVIRERVLKAVQEGAEYEKEIADAKALVESMRSELKEQAPGAPGVVRESAGTSGDKTYRVGGW